ncbi:hypothetical protein F511_05542 [Dorcoceras hygrometricum]|uniref:GTD-binding domain-containing protein n=1 Tax=Dorcoceras hygrometricum TaxID=472368 RepID=A0A2Z7CEL8_9LAMI|nr:hypothetical protein F511_05542 [Dorcoceras hygrometricum]
MACQVHTWSLSGLVAAIFNLAIAYLFLCVSAIAFFASKFLGFFGLELPCPCKNTPSKEHCFNRLLVDFPAQQVSNVQLSVKEKFPFNDSIWARNHDNNIGRDNYANGILEIEGDASCSSVSDVRQSRNLVGKDFGQWDEEYDVKGKGAISYRPRSRLHRRSRKGSVDHGKYSAVSSYDPSLHEEILGSIPHSRSSSNKGGDGFAGGSSFLDDYGSSYNIEYKRAPSVVGRRKSNLSSVQINNSSDDDTEVRKTVLSIEDLQEAKYFCGQEGNTIQLLEQALEEANAARDALYIELEKERNAAASAAEEAMAMILRLQEEKASIEMEARQHQRIFEEKSAYDAEEMDILKEILVRREMEKHLLEMEVEGYRQMASLGNQQLVDDGPSGAPTNVLGLLIDQNEDPVLMLRQLSASADEKLISENGCSSGGVNDSPIHFMNEKYISGKQENLGGQLMQMSGSADAVKMDFQEKVIISSEKSIPIERKVQEQSEEMDLVPGVEERNPKIVNGTGTSDLHYMQSLEPKEAEVCHELNDSGDLTLERDSHVYDVHVVGDGISSCSDENINKSGKLSVGGSLKVNDKISTPFEAHSTKCVNITMDSPRTSGMHAGVEVKRSNSEGYHVLPPVVPKVTSKLSNLRRGSMSTVENGILNIDYEVGQLLERLRIVKEGREKLSFSLENREKESLHLKHLEDAASQIQQICRLAEQGTAVRHVSPLLPS